MKNLLRCLMVSLLALTQAPKSLQAQKPFFMEAIPDQIQARLEVKVRAAANAAQSGKFLGPQFFMFFSKRWPQVPSKAITVAFNEGTDSLRSQIVSVASEWSQYGNFKFDFIDPTTGHYREWSRADTTFKADVRVAFDGIDGPGYWSLIGVDSSDPIVIAPNQASLDLQDFTTSLPPDWAAIVRHEFGHALGLMHEHQTPIGGCDQDFRWQDDSGYIPTQDTYGQYTNDSQGRRPGIYTFLAGPPNYWPQSKVDSSMRQLTADFHNYDFGPFDPTSVMKYYFDPFFFVSGTSSHCYSAENSTISQLDQLGIAKWYPSANSADLGRILREQKSLMQFLETTHKLRKVEGSK